MVCHKTDYIIINHFINNTYSHTSKLQSTRTNSSLLFTPKRSSILFQSKKKKKITSLPFLDSFTGFPSRNGSATKLSATYRSVHDNTPLYLSDLLRKQNPSHLLRSASRSLLDVPGPRDSKTKRYGQRAFRYVAPSLWNVLPESFKEKDACTPFSLSDLC